MTSQVKEKKWQAPLVPVSSALKTLVIVKSKYAQFHQKGVHLIQNLVFAAAIGRILWDGNLNFRHSRLAAKNVNQSYCKVSCQTHGGNKYIDYRLRL